MRRSFRLDDDLAQRLDEAAARVGTSASALIRAAVRQRCDEVLGHSLYDELRDYIGVVSLGPDASANTGRAFADLLAAVYDRRASVQEQE